LTAHERKVFDFFQVVRAHFGKVTVDVIQVDNVHLLLEQLLLLLLLINVAEKILNKF